MCGEQPASKPIQVNPCVGVYTITRVLGKTVYRLVVYCVLSTGMYERYSGIFRVSGILADCVYGVYGVYTITRELGTKG